MKFLGVPGVFDYAGLDRNSRYRYCSCCLPRISKSSASGFTVYGAEYRPRLYPCFVRAPRDAQRKTRGRAYQCLLHDPFEMEATVKCDRSGVESKATVSGRSGEQHNLSQMPVSSRPVLVVK